MQSKPSIVFVHGIWADDSSFSRVIPTLQAEGHEVIAARYGPDTLAGDVAAVKRTAGAGQQPRHPRRPLVRRNRDHSRGNR
jgi:hypothetical protein